MHSCWSADSCFIVQGNQVGKAWFTFSASMLATPDHILVICMDRSLLHNEALHHLSRDWAEADWLVVPCVLLLALFENQGHWLCFSHNELHFTSWTWSKMHQGLGGSRHSELRIWGLPLASLQHLEQGITTAQQWKDCLLSWVSFPWVLLWDTSGYIPSSF